MIVNTHELCSGAITRKRVLSNKNGIIKTEESILDYIIINQTMAEYLTKMTIDEDRIHVLTKYASRKGIKKLVKSDHNILTCHFNLKWKNINNNTRQVCHF